MRHLTVQQLSASLDGALVGVSLELVVRHLATCRECRDRHARLSKQDDTLRHLLACDPGAEYFEDASIRLETILDAESRGVAPPRVAEIEAHLPRVTLDEVMRGASNAAPPAPTPPAPVPASSTGKPAVQFPDWMQRSEPATPRPVVTPPVAPAHVPVSQRPPSLRVEPVEIAREEPAAIVTPVGASPVVPVAAPVAPAPQVAPDPVPAPAAADATPRWPLPAPRPASVPVPTPTPAPTAPLATNPPPAPAARPEPVNSRAPRRVAVPGWVTPLAATAAGITLLLAALSALPPVIRIPAPELPRFPRIELVKRQPRPQAGPTPASLAQAQAQAQAPDPSTTSVITPVPAPSAPVLVVTPAEESRVEPPRQERPRTIEPPAPTAMQTPVQAPRLRQQPPAPAPTPEPATVRPTVPAPSTTQAAAPVATETQTDTAADWPLLCGEVLDDAGAPVAGARVMLADLDLGARTDKRGRFCLAAPAGDRTLSVVAMGFVTARQVVSLDTQTLEVRIALRPTP